MLWVGTLIGWIIQAFGRFFVGFSAETARLITIETLKWAAHKAFWIFMVTVVFPFLLYNVVSMLILDLMDYGMTWVSGNIGNPMVVNLTGMGGWIGSQIGINNILSVYLTAIATKFVMGLIPGVRI